MGDPCKFDYFNKPVQFNVNYNNKNNVFSVISTSNNKGNINSINNYSGFSIGNTTNRAYLTLNNKICNWYDAIKSYARFNLLGQSIEFEINPIQISKGENVSLYLTPMNGSRGDKYCDIKNDCLELDIIEANCNGIQITAHSVADSKANTGCDTSGCFVGPVQNPDLCNLLNHNNGWITVKAEFEEDGIMNVYLNNVLYFDGKSKLTKNAKTEIYNVMKSSGVVIVLSLWGSGNTGMEWLSKCNYKCDNLPIKPIVYYKNFRWSNKFWTFTHSTFTFT